MEKLKFEFVVKAGEDRKKNVICVTSISDVGDHVFLIPTDLQPIKFHEELMKSEIYQKVKNTLQRRHERRQVWVSMKKDIRDTYMDEDGNMQFKGYLLEEKEITPNYQQKEETKRYNLGNLSEKFVIEKFSRKTSNVLQWMDIFESECTRLGIDDDIQKIQVFRVFLEDSCLDWYSSMLIKHTIDSEWCIWKKNFCETYASKGWSPVRYAILFKYRQGSLLDYALKKERLLLETNKSIDKFTLIDLIATGLPNFIADQIDRNNLKETEDLFNDLRGLEHLASKNTSGKKVVESEGKTKDKNVKPTDYRPCKICEKEKKGNRYHPESLCWFRNKDQDRSKREVIRSVNNSELETELNEIDPKN